MKTVALLALAAITGSLLQLETTMRIEAGGKTVGSLTYRYELTEDGITTQIDASYDGGEGEKVGVVDIWTYDKAGKPVSLKRTTTTPGESEFLEEVTFEDGAANWKGSYEGESETESFEVPEGGEIADPSIYWFVNVVPKPGEEAKYWTFDIDEMDWVESKTVYVGMEEIEFGGEKVRAHKVVVDDTFTIYVDDKGLPYRMIDEEDEDDIVTYERTG